MNNNEKSGGAVPPLTQLVGLYWHNPGAKELSSVYVLTERDAQDVKSILEKTNLEVSIALPVKPQEREASK